VTATRRTNALRACAGFAAIALACGCGGARDVTAIPAHPNAVQTGASSPQVVSVAFHIEIPRAVQSARRAQYVSSSTQSATIGVDDASATVNCTTSCEGSVDAPVGTDTFVVKLFDTQNGAGHLLSTGTTTQTIVFDAANVVALTFDGVVASLRVTIDPSSILPGTAGNAAVIVDALDADGNTIVGPGVYVDANGDPVTILLSNSDTSGASTLSQSAVTEPTTGITLNYTAALTASPTISASANGLAAGTASLQLLAPTLTALSASSGLIGTSVTETLTGTNFGANAAVHVSGDGISVSDVTVTSDTTMTATFFVDPEASLADRNVTVSTIAGTTSALTFTPSNAGVDVVTAATDGAAPSGISTGGGDAGELRYVMQHAAVGDTVVFDTNAMCGEPSCTIVLSGALPAIVQNLTIDGGRYGRVTIDGDREYRDFYISSGTVTLANLEIAHGLSHGGRGGSGNGGGGGGAGLGGGLFVWGGTALIVNDYFYEDGVIGGAGGALDARGTGGGGGGAFGGWLAGGAGDGGASAGNNSGGGGGGEFGDGTEPNEHAAICGGSGGQGDGVPGGAGGLAYGGVGTSGGYGAGGGGGCTGSDEIFVNGDGAGGGIGGGGGGASDGGGGSGLSGGSGLFAGGGGGGLADGFSEAGDGLEGGGTGGATGNGGEGGSAFGPAICVNSTVITTNSGAYGSYATAGGGGPGGGSGTDGPAGANDVTPVYALHATVNGTVVLGPVPGALGSTPPR
jgi:hypothetical protein